MALDTTGKFFECGEATQAEANPIRAIAPAKSQECGLWMGAGGF